MTGLLEKMDKARGVHPVREEEKPVPRRDRLFRMRRPAPTSAFLKPASKKPKAKQAAD
jgi:hypothetical protein